MTIPDQSNTRPISTQLTKLQKSVLTRAGHVEVAKKFGEDPGALAFASPFWASVSLPHVSPRNNPPFWESTTGTTTVSIVPGRKMGIDGKMTSAGYPFGIIPRQTLIYLATKAVQTQSPVIDMGNSFHEFVQRLSLKDGKATRDGIRKQLAALHAANISYISYNADNDGVKITDRKLNLTQSLDLWANWSKSDEPGLWGSSLELSEEFFSGLVSEEYGALPIYLDDLKALGGSSLRIDVYLWLVYRLFRVKGPTRITYAQLHQQFGGSYARDADFKRNFIPALKHVLTIYADARVSVHKDMIILFKSPPHVAPNRRKKLAS